VQCGDDFAAGSSLEPGSSSERSLKAAFHFTLMFSLFAELLHDLLQTRAIFI
jgi:hypothetical protein